MVAAGGIFCCWCACVRLKKTDFSDGDVLYMVFVRVRDVENSGLLSRFTAIIVYTPGSRSGHSYAV
jgi:hypothetical protein